MRTYDRVEIRNVRDETCYLRCRDGRRQRVYVDGGGEMHDLADQLLPDEREESAQVE